MIRAHKNKTALGLLALTLAWLLVVAPAASVRAADHGDAPATAQDLGADINDAYLFLDPNDNNQVIMILTLHGFIVPGEAGNFGVFDPALRHRFEIERTGDARPDAFVDVTFSRRVAVNAVPQPQMATINLSGFGNNATFTAPATNPSPTAATPPAQVVTTNAATGIRFFAGLTDDPFFFDIPAFGRFVASARAGTPNPSFFTRGRDSFAGYNTLAIALSIPVSLVRGATSELGLSAATQRRNPEVYNSRSSQISGFGRWVNIDRTGVPAVNVALVPFNSKDEYNSANTLDDAAGRFAAGIVSTLTLFGTPPANAAILANLAIVRGDILRVNLDTANSGPGGGNNAGAGFPNGRRLADDVIDTEIQLLGGTTTLGDNVNANDMPFNNTFPFLPRQQPPRDPGVIDDNTRN
jgi:hypothetical protein